MEKALSSLSKVTSCILAKNSFILSQVDLALQQYIPFTQRTAQSHFINRTAAEQDPVEAMTLLASSDITHVHIPMPKISNALRQTQSTNLCATDSWNCVL